jgi:hypothetical protein
MQSTCSRHKYFDYLFDFPEMKTFSKALISPVRRDDIVAWERYTAKELFQSNVDHGSLLAFTTRVFPCNVKNL